ncbi:MAG: hypothetical protein ACR2JI_16990 [Mycobacterium sp.]
MTGDTADEVLARYRRRDPYVSRARALALDTLSKRYTPLLVAAREKLEVQRAVERAELRRKLFGQ